MRTAEIDKSFPEGEAAAPSDLKTDGSQSDVGEEFTISVRPAAMARDREGRPRS